MSVACSFLPNIPGKTYPPLTEWEIICDFDGTITPFDVTDAILEQFADPEWEGIEETWQSGAITARECMDRQIRLIRAPRATFDDFLDSVPVDEAFPRFMRFVTQQGLRLTVVSDGMDYVIRRILARHGLHGIPVIANRLVLQKDGAYRLEFPYGNDICGSGVCKCRVADAEATGRPVLLVGDGRSDCCLAANATLVLAKEGQTLLQLCRDKNYPHLSYSGFADIHTLFECWGTSSYPQS